MGKSLETGHVLDSGRYRYQIEKVLGQGGFGITYLASTTVKVGNVSLRAKFAIKEHFISSDCERESGTSKVVYSAPARERVENSRKDFIAEARRLQTAGSGHPSIVKVNEIFEANNTAYYVMEYLDGMSLHQYVARMGKLSEKSMKELMEPIIEAVGVLHSNKMTHLDIKPENIMVAKDEEGNPRPVLIDFGLSKHYDSDGTPTSTINILGCSDGFSPTEQYLGITTFSPEADVYAVGATIFYCLTGRTPKKASELRDGELARELDGGAVSKATVSAVARATKLSKFDREKDVTSLFNYTEPEEEEAVLEPTLIAPGYVQGSTVAIGDGGGQKPDFKPIKPIEPIEEGGGGSKLWKILTVVGVLAVVALGIIFLANGEAEGQGGGDEVLEHQHEHYVEDMKWTSPLGEAIYTGDVEEIIIHDEATLLPHGHGVAKLTAGEYEGNIYDGEFDWGKMHGQTKYTMKNGDTFEGTFRYNKYEKGRYTIGSTGEYFEGTFKDGQPAQGQWYDKNGKKI